MNEERKLSPREQWEELDKQNALRSAQLEKMTPKEIIAEYVDFRQNVFAKNPDDSDVKFENVKRYLEVAKAIMTLFKKHAERFNAIYHNVAGVMEQNKMIMPLNFFEFIEWHFRENSRANVEVKKVDKVNMIIDANLPDRQDFVLFSKHLEKEMFGKVKLKNSPLPKIKEGKDEVISSLNWLQHLFMTMDEQLTFETAFERKIDYERVINALIELQVLNENKEWIYKTKTAIPLIIEAIVSRIDIKVSPPNLCELFAEFVGLKIHNKIKYVSDDERPKPGSKVDKLRQALMLKLR
ncbi:hypothetical protein [Haliscomenobacter sp.]|uniref:hypothetical protein n=1 Tax=Haliscomenobacter sp. TaxID=2717303 RepID=UPI003BAD1DB4